MRAAAMLLLALCGVSPQQGDPPAVGERVWAKPDHFWFRKTVPGGNLWLTVDARHGAKSPLFDHQRLAIELSLRTGHEFTPLTLPFADPSARFTVRYDGSNAYIQEGAMAVEFVLDGYQWRCELQIKWDWNKVPPTDYECTPRRPASVVSQAAAAGTAGVVTSPDEKLDALVVKHNVAVRPAGGGTLRMLTSDGKDGDAYDPGSLRWSADSRTVRAYRLHASIWTMDGVSGSVRRLITLRTLTP